MQIVKTFSLKNTPMEKESNFSKRQHIIFCIIKLHSIWQLKELLLFHDEISSIVHNSPTLIGVSC